MNGNQEPEGSSGKEEEKKPLVLPPASPTPTPSPSTEWNKDIPTPISSKQEPAVVKEIQAKVDITKKPEERKEQINLLDDADFFAQQTNPTEGDAKQKALEKERVEKLKNSLGATPASSSSNSTKSSNPDKRLAQAEKWGKALDLVRIWGLKMWSGQADNEGLIVSTPDQKVLAEALADVMEEYNFDPAPLLTLAVTVTAVWGTSISNASDSRKKIREFRKTEEYQKAQAERMLKKEKPDLDPLTGTHAKRRGGQRKT